jgi:hypothetical protein
MCERLGHIHQEASPMKALPTAVLAGVLGVGMLAAIPDSQLVK